MLRVSRQYEDRFCQHALLASVFSPHSLVALDVGGMLLCNFARIIDALLLSLKTDSFVTVVGIVELCSNRRHRAVGDEN